jgi:hypothetical protein
MTNQMHYEGIHENRTSIFCTLCAGVQIDAGLILTFTNTVSIPRNPSHILFDGRDKIYSTRSLSISRASYPFNPGTVHADATESQDLWLVTVPAIQNSVRLNLGCIL